MFRFFVSARSDEARPFSPASRPYKWPMFIGLLLLGMLLIPLTASTQTIPTISVESVAPGSSVTIRTHNFPANQTFTVTMGKMWTAGINGIVVGTINSGSGASQSFSFNIPAELKGDAQISIRAQTSHASPWFAYNFFNNGDSSGSANNREISAPTSGYTGYPTFSIAAVKPRESVTIRTNNFPLNQTFTVTMGKMGTAGVNGIVVGKIDSTDWKPGQEYTFTIPAELKDDFQVSIRAQTAHANPYYAYNFFTNNASGPGAREPENGSAADVYVGIPTFTVTAVDPGKTVTIRTNNFPANQTFTVTMGKMWTRGVDGIVVGTINSGAGGTADYSFNIPAELTGDDRVSIRAQTAHADPYYAFNWFWNTADAANNNDNAGSRVVSGQGGEPYVGTPSFMVCAVEKNANVTIRTHNFPANQTFTVTMGQMYSQGVNGVVVGTLDSGDGTSKDYSYTIPAGLQGRAQIAIRAQTSHANPFFAYNWFYNNTANVCP